MKGQINIFDYLSGIPVVTFGGCGQCICKKCLYWWSGRCPNGYCFDDKRAVDDPYDRAHPDKSPRTLWSDWNKPGEQAHWCRGGVCYPVYHCNHFKKYIGVKNADYFRDGVGYLQTAENEVESPTLFDFIKD